MQKPHLPVRNGKLPRLMYASIGPKINLRKSWSTFRHDTVFAPKQYLNQKEATGIQIPKMHSSSRCKNRTGRHTTPSHVSQYRAKNGNLWNSGSTIGLGTVFALKQCLYQNEATGMESPKMHSSVRCINRTYLCRTANYPVSRNPEYGRKRKFE